MQSACHQRQPQGEGRLLPAESIALRSDTKLTAPELRHLDAFQQSKAIARHPRGLKEASEGSRGNVSMARSGPDRPSEARCNESCRQPTRLRPSKPC